MKGLKVSPTLIVKQANTVTLNQTYETTQTHKLYVHNQGPVSRKSRELFGPEKLVIKLQSARFEKLIRLHVFNIRKTKWIAKFEGLEPWRCEDIKGVVAPEIGPKSFGTFEKQAPGIICLDLYMRARFVTFYQNLACTHTHYKIIIIAALDICE